MTVSWMKTLSDIQGCIACPLHSTRANTVPGEGDTNADLLLIGEGPGAQEDAQGRPFVGPAGQLLDKMLAAIGLSRQQVYIANVVKCRPPGNRAPTPLEVDACLPYLRAQTALIRPRVIVLLGATAAQAVLGPHIRITRDRGRWERRGSIMLLPTFHPAALLRDPSKKRAAWEDFQSIRDTLRSTRSEQEGRNGGE